MWTDEEINQHSVFLDKQEELALNALKQGICDLTQIEKYVVSVAGQCDIDYIQSVITLQTAPDGKVKLEAV